MGVCDEYIFGEDRDGEKASQRFKKIKDKGLVIYNL